MYFFIDEWMNKNFDDNFNKAGDFSEKESEQVSQENHSKEKNTKLDELSQKLHTPENEPNEAKGTIIPIASGDAAIISTKFGGVADKQAFVGYGTSQTATIVKGRIDLTGTPSAAFSMPRDGMITSLSGFFSLAEGKTLVGSEITVTAQIYQSNMPNNSFAPIPGASVTLSPALTGSLPMGAVTSGAVCGLSVPVSKGTRLLYVLSAHVTGGVAVAENLSGTISGGIGIE